MTNPRKLHSSPFEPNQTPASESGDRPSNAPDGTHSTTFGLPEGWWPIHEWASTQNVIYEVFFLIDAAFLNEEPTLLGTVLSEISSAAAAQFLEDSADSAIAPKLLHRLALAYAANSALPTKFRPYQHRQNAARQLGSKSDRYLSR